MLRLTILIVAMACMSDAVFAQSPAVHSTPPDGQLPKRPTMNHFALDQSLNQKRAKEKAYVAIIWVIKVVILGVYLLMRNWPTDHQSWSNNTEYFPNSSQPSTATSSSGAVNFTAGSHQLCEMKQVVVPVGLGFYGKAGVVLLNEWEHVGKCKATSNPDKKP